MTERFKKVIPHVLQNEGYGFTDIAHDKGGATKMGITLGTIKALKMDLNGDGSIDAKDVKDMTIEDAYSIYYNNYYKPYYETLDEKLGAKLFDVAVNCGNKRSNILLQRALNRLGSKLDDDGIVGNATFTEVTKYKTKDILREYCVVQKAFYDAIVKNDPNQKKFIKGWHNRADFMCS